MSMATNYNWNFDTYIQFLVGWTATTNYKWISRYEAQIERKTMSVATNYNWNFDTYIQFWTSIDGLLDSNYKLQIYFKILISNWEKDNEHGY